MISNNSFIYIFLFTFNLLSSFTEILSNHENKNNLEIKNVKIEKDFKCQRNMDVCGIDLKYGNYLNSSYEDYLNKVVYFYEDMPLECRQDLCFKLKIKSTFYGVFSSPISQIGLRVIQKCPFSYFGRNFASFDCLTDNNDNSWFNFNLDSCPGPPVFETIKNNKLNDVNKNQNIFEESFISNMTSSLSSIQEKYPEDPIFEEDFVVMTQLLFQKLFFSINSSFHEFLTYFDSLLSRNCNLQWRKNKNLFTVLFNFYQQIFFQNNYNISFNGKNFMIKKIKLNKKYKKINLINTENFSVFFENEKIDEDVSYKFFILKKFFFSKINGKNYLFFREEEKNNRKKKSINQISFHNQDSTPTMTSQEAEDLYRYTIIIYNEDSKTKITDRELEKENGGKLEKEKYYLDDFDVPTKSEFRPENKTMTEKFPKNFEIVLEKIKFLLIEKNYKKKNINEEKNKNFEFKFFYNAQPLEPLIYCEKKKRTKYILRENKIHNKFKLHINYTTLQISSNIEYICVFLPYKENFDLNGKWAELETKISTNKIECFIPEEIEEGFIVIFEIEKNFYRSDFPFDGFYDFAPYIPPDFAVFWGFPYIYELSVLSFVLRTISLLTLVFTVISYCIFKKIRKSTTTFILLNLCFSLIFLLIILFISEYKANEKFSCRVFNILRYYFCFVSLLWNGVEGHNMYLMMIKIFHFNKNKFAKISFILAWGVPILLVMIIMLINKKSFDGIYIDCKLQCTLKPLSMYLAWIFPMLLIILHNSIVFVLVLRVLWNNNNNKNNDANKKKTSIKQRLIGAVGILVLLGAPWLLSAFGAIRVDNDQSFHFFQGIIEVIFILLISLQGFFIFLFHCVRNRQVRNEWSSITTKSTLASSIPSSNK